MGLYFGIIGSYMVLTPNKYRKLITLATSNQYKAHEDFKILIISSPDYYNRQRNLFWNQGRQL